jgi:hypothetical protein
MCMEILAIVCSAAGHKKSTISYRPPNAISEKIRKKPWWHYQTKLSMDRMPALTYISSLDSTRNFYVITR